jgi:nucleoside-diphosphate-sugar epimerase
MTAAESRADLVVGGHGFLGHAIARRLLASGRRVRVLTRRGGAVSAPPEPTPGLESVEGDVNSTKLLPSWLQGIEVVYFAVPIGDLAEAPGDWNALPFLAACAEAGVRLVVANDISLYAAAGNPPHDEKTDMTGRGPLGEAQLEWENMALIEGLRRRFAVTVLRLPPLLGSGLTHSLLRDIIARVRSGRPLEVAGRGEEITEMLHVDDAARACVLAGSRPDTAGEIIHVPGHPIRRRNLLRVLVKVAESKTEIVSVPLPESPARSRRRGGAAAVGRDFWVRGDKARRLLGYAPELSYERAFRESLANLAGAAKLL